MNTTLNASIPKWLLAALLAVGLAGCGGGGGGGDGGGGGQPTTFTVGGTVSGLDGTVVLRNNGGNDLTLTANGAFTFSTALASGAAYSVTIQTHPSYPAQECTITNGSGTASANVTNIAVACSSLDAADLHADAGVRSAALHWTSPADAVSFNVYVSSARDCDIANYATCPDGALVLDVESPHTIAQLSNAQPYFFRIETVYANGTRGLSNEAGARPNALAFNNAVHSIAAADDGTAYLGGEFTSVGITTGSAVPLDAATGRLAAPDFPIVDGWVYVTAPDGVGGWYIGGEFTRVGGVPRRNLAHILANGAVDPDFDAGMDNNSEVYALAVSGGTVYVGGPFIQAGGEVRNRLAAFDADGGLLPWNPSADNVVFTLAISGDTVYVGGGFAQVGGAVRRNLVAVDARGQGAVLPWNPGANGTVQALAISDNVVYAGGSFTQVGAEMRNRLAAIDAALPEVLPWNPNADNIVRTLVISDNVVYAGGSFTQVGAEMRNRLAAIDVNGTPLPWNPALTGFSVEALAVSGETVYAGGLFTQVSGEPRSYFAAIGTDGTLLPWSLEPNSPVNALAISDGVVYVGGSFTAVAAQQRNRLAAVDADGALLSWDPNAAGPVLALAISGGTVYAGGVFTAINGEGRTRLAAIDVNGTLLPWRPAANSRVSALAVSTGGTLYAGGDFTGIDIPLGGGQSLAFARTRLAAFDANGGLLPWNPAANAMVNTLSISGSGNLYVGGSFTSIRVGGAGGPVLTLPRAHLAAFDANGGLLPWGAATNDIVRTLAVSGGRVYAGGDFTAVGLNNPGIERFRLAAFDGVTGEPLPWNLSTNATVRSLAVSGDTLYAGGDFTAVNGGVQRNHLAAFAAGGELLPWNPATNSTVMSLATSGDTVHVGGFFTTLGERTRIGFGTVSAIGEGAVVP